MSLTTGKMLKWRKTNNNNWGCNNPHNNEEEKMNVMNEIGKTLKLPKNKPQVTIIWGSDRDPRNKETYRFETEEQLKYFMMGVDEANGWLEYEVQE